MLWALSMMDKALGKRIAIIGSGGAGKSTLSFALSRLGALPLIHLDRITWLSGWVLRDRAEADAELYRALEAENWVLDAAFPRHLAKVLERADQVLFLDLGRWRCVRRVAWRILSNYGQQLPEMADGCPEKGDLAFLRWIWNWEQTHRPHIVAQLEGRAQVLWFKHPRELQAWLKGLRDS